MVVPFYRIWTTEKFIDKSFVGDCNFDIRCVAVSSTENREHIT